jgi:hypothetical protein
LLVFVFVPFTQRYIHPSSFWSQSFHFFTGIPFLLVVLLSLLLLLVIFLFSPAFRQYPALFLPSILSSNFSLSRFHSQPIPLASFHHVSLSTLITLLKYFSCTLSTSFCSFHPLYHASNKHSPPEITSPIFLFYSPHTSHYFVLGPLVEGVAQILAPSLSFYLTSFPFPLILLTLPLSLVEQHHFRLLNIYFQLILPHILSKEAPHHLFHSSLTLCHYYQVYFNTIRRLF